MDFTPRERAVYALRDGDLLLTEASGSEDQVGRPAIWRGELDVCCFQNTVIRVRPHLVDPEFALIVFRQYMLTGVFAETSRGIGIHHLGAARLAALPFPLPPLAEQGRIAREANRRLGDLRDGADSLKSALARAHEQESAVLAAAVNGGLLRGNDQSGSETTTRLPDGWRTASVGEVGDVRLGKQRSPANHDGPNLRPYLRVANVFEDRLDMTDVKNMDFAPEEVERFSLRYGDVLLNEGQSLALVGRPAIYRDELPEGCFQNTLLRFRAGPDVDPEFALIVFRHYMRSGEFTKIARGSTNIAHLSRTRFVKMPFPLPPIEQQRKIVTETRRLLDESQERRQTMSVTLERIGTVEEAIFSAAVSGVLLLQDAADESAEALSQRLGAPPTDQIDPKSEIFEEDRMAKVEKVRPHAGDISLSSILRQMGPLTVPELCRAAGFDRNDVGEVERFYLALREEVGTSIETVGEGNENQTVKAIDRAT